MKHRPNCQDGSNIHWFRMLWNKSLNDFTPGKNSAKDGIMVIGILQFHILPRETFITFKRWVIHIYTKNVILLCVFDFLILISSLKTFIFTWHMEIDWPILHSSPYSNLQLRPINSVFVLTNTLLNPNNNISHFAGGS